MKNILEIDKIEKYYGSRASITKAVDNISFEVQSGEFVAIMGASGSGKTTLLNLISTIDKVTAGHIYVAGTDITKLKGNELNRFRREELGFIFQDFNLLDNLTAYENIALALSIQNVNSAEIERRVKKVAEDLDIQNILQKYPYQMSGGQKAKLLLLKMVLNQANVLLLDEPTRNFSPTSQPQIRKLFTSYTGAFITVSHDRTFLKEVCQKIYCLTETGLEQVRKEQL